MQRSLKPQSTGQHRGSPPFQVRSAECVGRAERENWGYKRLLVHLCESEEQDRRERKMRRLLKESGLPEGKTLGNLEEKLLPPKIRRLLPTLLEGHFVARADNLLAFGLPGRGKTHFLAALGRELILRHRYPVLFTPTYKLVQQLLVAKWDQIFKDPMTTMAAIDRLVHHAQILEFTGESVRAQKAQGREPTPPPPAGGPCGSTAGASPKRLTLQHRRPDEDLNPELLANYNCRQ